MSKGKCTRPKKLSSSCHMLSILGGYSSKKRRGFLYNAFHVKIVTNFAACRDLDKHFSILQNIATATTSCIQQ